MEIAMKTKEAIQTKSSTVTAYEMLRTDLLEGKLRPTERLRINAISKKYEIGATAIREALSRLVSDGLVEFEDQKGFAVAAVSQAELLDLTRTRQEIECLAARKAVQIGNLDWESKMIATFHKLSRTSPPTSPEATTVWADAHRAFHEAIVAGCDSPWLVRLCGLLYDKSERYRNLTYRSAVSAERNNTNEHNELLNAALDRDADKLCNLLTAHFEKTANLINKNYVFSTHKNLKEIEHVN
jgi:GntR family transcriptional regulator, carbon starvation induced regulator